jgi:hypothetical protein
VAAAAPPGFTKVKRVMVALGQDRRWLQLPPGRPEGTGMSRDVGRRHISSEVLANCRRCGQPVRESHSHVMIVPVGRARMFFHGGCEPIEPTADQDAKKERKTDRE